MSHRANLQAAYLLVFADTASSVAVVLNSVLVRRLTCCNLEEACVLCLRYRLLRWLAHRCIGRAT